MVATSSASSALSLYAKPQQNLQALVGYVPRNLPLANTWQTGDPRNGGLRVHHSWLFSLFGFQPRELKYFFLASSLLGPEQT